MKVMLIRPPAPNVLSFTKVLDNEPLELEYLHTVLKRDGYEDYIYDGLTESFSASDVMIREHPDVVAITGYITQEKMMLKLAAEAKNLNPPAITIIGGVHAQINYERFYNKHVDYIFRSESMDAFSALMRTISSNTGNLYMINGLCVREKSGNYTVNKLMPTDINSLPIPDRSFFYQHCQSYRYLDLTEVATVKFAFSCPYGCNFCYCTLLSSGLHTVRRMDLIMDELSGLRCQNVQIVDDDFLLDPDFVHKFIKEIKQRGIKKTFICYARADFVAAHPDLIMELSHIGFRYFLIGLEAVSDDELNNYNKKTSVDVNRQCVANINNTSADCIALLIAPLDANRQYFDNLYRWITDNGLKYVTVSVFTPIPGTPLYEEYEQRLISDDIEDWDFLHLVVEPENLTKSQFYAEYYKLFVKLYNLARKTGIYDFMDLKFYMDMLSSYLRRKMRDK